MGQCGVRHVLFRHEASQHRERERPRGDHEGFAGTFERCSDRFDGTEVGPRLVEDLLRRLGRIDPISVAAFEMAGSPALPLLRAALGKERPSASVFMAGAIDRRALLKDAVRVLRRRRANGLRLRVGSDTATVGRGPPTVTVSMEPTVLLGLVFGIRDLPTELRRGTVRVSPTSTRGLEVVRAAFPPRRIWIADAW